MFNSIARHAKSISLIAGFLFGTLGAAWSFAFDDRLKETEATIIAQGQDRVPELLKNLFEIEKAINANRAAQQKNRVMGPFSSIFGSLLLLSANLVAESGRGRNAKG